MWLLISSGDNHSLSQIAGMMLTMKSQQTSHEEQVATVKGILLSNMLEFLNISLDRYFEKTTPGDRERHISRCRRCSGLRDCVHMLLGDAIDPSAFCPNSRELKQLM